MITNNSSSFVSIYPKKLEIAMRENHFIPRLLRDHEKFKLYHRYWDCYNDDIFKINEIFDIDGITYYVANYGDENYISIITDSTSTNSYYEILKDYYCIAEQNIINNSYSYTGAEIKYWFVINGNQLDNAYKEFYKYFSANSKVRLFDSKKYLVEYNPNSFTPCNIIREQKPRG